MSNDSAFHGRRGYWLRQLSDCAESDFSELLHTLIAYGGRSPSLWAKVMDGVTAQGTIDPKTPLHSLGDVAGLQAQCSLMGVGFAPVVVPRGIGGEVALHASVALGIGCLVVDIEAGQGFWDQSSTDGIPGYWLQLRSLAPNAYLVSQPDPRNLESVYTSESLSYFDAFAPQHYVGWTDVGWTDVVAEVARFDWIRALGKDVYPTLWGTGDAAIAATFWRAVRDYSAGNCAFNLGAIGPRQFGWLSALKLPAEPL